MDALKDLFKSERGIIGLALLIGATVLTAIGKMPLERWEHFSALVFGIYVAGKSATGVAAAITAGKIAVAHQAIASAYGPVDADDIAPEGGAVAADSTTVDTVPLPLAKAD